MFVTIVSKVTKIRGVKRFLHVRTMHSLLKNQAYINGKWTNAGDNKSFKVTNPANDECIGNVPDMNVSDVQTAIDSAYEAFHSEQWQNTTAKERSGLLKVNCYSWQTIHARYMQIIITQYFTEMVSTS